MAHSMKLKVVAEGVENQAQLDLLGEYAVDEIQGYLLGKPVDAEELEQMLRNPQRQLGSAANVVQLRP
jgi:EAL domain-containing protein (putative c-di-GMP-specific phosphodiesterase class I)